MTEDNHEGPFAWSPPGDPLVGGIVMKVKPKSVLNRPTYQYALASRIARLVAAEDEDEAWRLLKVVGIEDSNVGFRSLRDFPPALVNWSEWLNMKARFPVEGIPAESLIHDADLLDLLASEDTLETFLTNLYDGGRSW